MVAPKVSFMGPDGLYQEELLKAATCDAAIGINMRITFASLPFEQMVGKGGEIYKLYKERYKIEPTSYALYSWEAAEVIIQAIKRANAKDREKIRAAIAATKDFDGLNGKWRFDENGDTTIDIMSGFKVVKAEGPVGCKFEFVEVLE